MYPFKKEKNREPTSDGQVDFPGIGFIHEELVHVEDLNGGSHGDSVEERHFRRFDGLYQLETKQVDRAGRKREIERTDSDITRVLSTLAVWLTAKKEGVAFRREQAKAFKCERAFWENNRREEGGGG